MKGYAGAIPNNPPVALPTSKSIKRGLAGIALLLGTVFTNAGAAIVTNRIIQAGTAPKYAGWGIGTSGPTTADTTLGTESSPTTSGGRTACTESRVTTSVTNDTYQDVGTITAVSTLAITEFGLFDAVSTGNLLLRSVFAALNVVSGDSIAFTAGLKFIPG